MALKQFDINNVQTSKQFNSALSDVFAGITGRNKQLQQLLIIAVNEAARISGGQVTNNLSWLSAVLAKADETKGVNGQKIALYVKEVLCCKSVAWDVKKLTLKKSPSADVLEYNLAPEVSWYDFGKDPSVKEAFDWHKKTLTAMKSALDEGKGNMSVMELMAIAMEAGVTSVDLGLALQFMADDAAKLDTNFDIPMQ